MIRSMLALSLLLVAGPASAADASNCLMCHKYRGLNRVEEDGTLHVFYVDEALYGQTVHAGVKCEGCHVDIEQIPHESSEPVDCLETCHLNDPSTDRPFSHQATADALASSVHNAVDEDGNPKDHAVDYPICKDCHDNPFYRPFSMFKTMIPGVTEAATGRCRVCHEGEDFVNHAYVHVTTNLRRGRNPKEISEACSRCHDDPTFVARHGLGAKAGVTYDETFHGKAASFLNEAVPDCIDCHVHVDQSAHTVLAHEDPTSPTHPDNKKTICAQSDCHPDAEHRTSAYDPHAEFVARQGTFRHFVTVFFYLLAGGTLLPLLGLILLDLLRRIFPEAVFDTGRRRRDA